MQITRVNTGFCHYLVTLVPPRNIFAGAVFKHTTSSAKIYRMYRERY